MVREGPLALAVYQDPRDVAWMNPFPHTYMFADQGGCR